MISSFARLKTMACLTKDIVRYCHDYKKRSEEKNWELHIPKSSSPTVMEIKDEVIIEVTEAQNLQSSRKFEEYSFDDVNKMYLDDKKYNNEDHPDLAKSLESYKKQFVCLDVSGDGYLETEELENMMRRHTEIHSHVELSRMVSEIDRENRGAISYNDFLYTMLSRENTVLKNTLKFEIATRMEDVYPKGVPEKRDISSLP